jgi:hypothetical protein
MIKKKYFLPQKMDENWVARAELGSKPGSFDLLI